MLLSLPHPPTAGAPSSEGAKNGASRRRALQISIFASSCVVGANCVRPWHPKSVVPIYNEAKPTMSRKLLPSFASQMPPPSRREARVRVFVGASIARPCAGFMAQRGGSKPPPYNARFVGCAVLIFFCSHFQKKEVSLFPNFSLFFSKRTSLIFSKFLPFLFIRARLVFFCLLFFSKRKGGGYFSFFQEKSMDFCLIGTRFCGILIACITMPFFRVFRRVFLYIPARVLREI